MLIDVWLLAINTFQKPAVTAPWWIFHCDDLTSLAINSSLEYNLFLKINLMHLHY